MASSATAKEVAKAIDVFFREPSLPLPDDLTTLLDVYLERYDRGEEAGINDDLLALYEKYVVGKPENLAAFLVVLRCLLPMIRTRTLLLPWCDRLIDPVLDFLPHQKGLANEALGNVTALATMDSGEEQSINDGGLTPFAGRLMVRWVEVHRAIQSGDERTEFKVRLVRECLMIYGKKDPKKFMTGLDAYMVKRDSRNAALTLLAEFIRSQPPHLHLVLDTPLFGNILQSLQKDSSTTTVALALVALNMLLPYIPSSLVPFLPTLFNIYARLLFWERDKSFAVAHTEQEMDMESLGHNSTWEESLINPDNDPYSIPHLSEYYTLLYGLYPINFLDYIRKPQRYLRHANNAEDIDVQSTEIRDRSGRFTKHHLLHANFYSLTIETEKTDFSRWIKCEAHEVLADCMALSVLPDRAAENGYGVVSPAQSLNLSTREGADRDNLNYGLLSTSVAGDATSSSRDSLSAHWRHTQSTTAMDSQIGPSSTPSVRRNSQSSHVSTRASGDGRPRDFVPDSPTLPPHLVQSPSNSQLQDMIQSNKVIKSGLHQSHGNESVLSLALSHQDSIPEKASAQLPLPQQSNVMSGSTADLSDKLSHAYHQILLLQNDLQFERYIKEQHMAHIGELRRKQLREEATEAETQNLVMAARNMRRRLEEAKLSEAQIKKESDHRRNMSHKWDADLSAKLKLLREDQRKWAASREQLERDLAAAKGESEKLRVVVLEADERKLMAEQALEAIDINADEIERLRSEVARLSASERRFQGKEETMQTAIEEAAVAKAQAKQLSADLAARDGELHQARRLYESQIVVLNTRLADAQKNDPSQAQNNVAAVFESALAASRAKQSELQKQYSTLMRKYTVLQSSILDMQADLAEKKGRAGDRTSSFDPDAEMSPGSSPVDIRNKGHRVFSDFDGLDGSPATAGSQQPHTPPIVSPLDAAAGGRNSPERYFGRGGVQNTIRKDRKDKDDKDNKKEKKATGMQRIRGFV
ncbi:hypothetical protein GQ53DRAFT_832848 [Thozetella sp. PMI_491]|nr:hypothetical protein GQ53DRAFT_832848 [Thozetella sp. PMI_491]